MESQDNKTHELLIALAPYKKLIEKSIAEGIEELGPKSLLRDACEYALMNGGKRFRPALVLMIGKALGNNVNLIPAALGIEFFHTASLIADDLPCMDNDTERRNMPSTHIAFGESIALMATYALISAGYEKITQNSQLIKEGPFPFSSNADELCVLAIQNISYNTGILGATGGQFLDLRPPVINKTNVLEILHKKTVTLFEISFVLGWLFGGGDIEKLPLVKKAAGHFGLAFQIADDLEDRQQDLDHQHDINLANLFGVDEAKRMFHEEMSQFKHLLKELNLCSREILALTSLQV